MYVFKDSAAPAHAYTCTQARGATPELRRVADTTSHGLSAGRNSTQTTIGSPSPYSAWPTKKGEEGEGGGSSKTILGLEPCGGGSDRYLWWRRRGVFERFPVSGASR